MWDRFELMLPKHGLDREKSRAKENCRQVVTFEGSGYLGFKPILVDA
jgi:hypothetical protein